MLAVVKHAIHAHALRRLDTVLAPCIKLHKNSPELPVASELDCTISQPPSTRTIACSTARSKAGSATAACASPLATRHMSGCCGLSDCSHVAQNRFEPTVLVCHHCCSCCQSVCPPIADARCDEVVGRGGTGNVGTQRDALLNLGPHLESNTHSAVVACLKFNKGAHGMAIDLCALDGNKSSKPQLLSVPCPCRAHSPRRQSQQSLHVPPCLNRTKASCWQHLFDIVMQRPYSHAGRGGRCWQPLAWPCPALCNSHRERSALPAPQPPRHQPAAVCKPRPRQRLQ